MEINSSVSEFLGNEFVRRKHRNKSYSLRAFARDLNISASRLSEILSGKHGLSEKTADLIADGLGLKTKQRQRLKDLILAEHARSAKVRELAQKRIDEAKSVDPDKKLREEEFRIISDWYHGAILELTLLPDFKSEESWIARRLGISAQLVSEAIERLMNVGLLARKQGELVAVPEVHFTTTDIPSAAIRKFHRQILSMHHESLLNDQIHEREFHSMIVALPKEAVAEFGAEMRKFTKKFWEKYSNSPKEDLYSFSLQICPVKDRKRRDA